jgi:hypothetical protein
MSSQPRGARRRPYATLGAILAEAQERGLVAQNVARGTSPLPSVPACSLAIPRRLEGIEQRNDVLHPRPVDRLRAAPHQFGEQSQVRSVDPLLRTVLHEHQLEIGRIALVQPAAGLSGLDRPPAPATAIAAAS